MTTGSRGIQRWRRTAGAAQGVLFLALPFVRVGGESALRFDARKIHTHTFALEDLPTALRYAKDRVDTAVGAGNFKPY